MLKWSALLLIGIAAIVDDMARRRISNWIPVLAAVFGIGYQVFEKSWEGGVSALIGALTGSAVFLIFYVAGGMGGGDIKLMAGFGAILGANGIFVASLWTAAVGGILAAFLIVWKFAFAKLASPGPAPTTSPAKEAMPYAPAIAVGVWLSQLANQ